MRTNRSKDTIPSTLSTALRLAATVLTLIAIPCSVALADTNQVYLEQGGYIHFEAEDADTVSDWTINTDLHNYSGNGYLEWTGSDHFPLNRAGKGTITYHFLVETAGNYELRWRSRIAKGESNTESNDTWVRFNTGDNVPGEEPLSGWSKVYMGEFGIWSWSARTVDHVAQPLRQYFSAGNHTVQISGRSFGHAIDRIALYRYSDVNFDPGLNGTLPLSLYAREDGSIVDPNPIFIPNPTPTPSPHIETEPQTENNLAQRVNVTPINSTSIETSAAYCTANTLTLPAIDAASTGSVGQISSFSRDELLIEADIKNVLLAFDLSSLPAYSTATLRYFTGTEISNGSLNAYLGSHNDWINSSVASTADATVKIADAQGGWDSLNYYETELDASLLPQDIATIILSLSSGSDPLQLFTQTGKQALPVLAITGDENFCVNWESNSIASISGNFDENSEKNNLENSSDTDEATSNRKSGGSTSAWLVILFLAGLGRKRVLCHS